MPKKKKNELFFEAVLLLHAVCGLRRKTKTKTKPKQGNSPTPKTVKPGDLHRGEVALDYPEVIVYKEEMVFPAS